ncbi:hypothetical protein C8R45DRAFT_334027 [Mycena sanguinolenta]|nr:hypothetical protein C8R45DRAFT_334027 [Mycena sanguinolenta]
MPIPEDLSPTRPHDACKLQFSAIDGGTILTFAMSHCVSDGTGTDQWMRILTEETQFVQEGSAQRSETTTVGLDRSFLCNIESELAFNIDKHPAYMFKSEEVAPPSEDSNVFGVSQSEVPVLLRLSPAGLAQLKTDATTPGERISTHDALCALMWRTVLLIRSRRPSQQNISSSTTSNLFMPTNARRHLPGLPSPYVGNAVYQLIAGLDLDTLLSPSGLQRAAAEIRRAISAITPELVFMNGTIFTTSVAMGTCLGSGDVMYGSDWGKAFGPVVRFRLIGEPGNVVFPKRPDGSAELILDALPEEVEILKGVEGFGKYLAL